MDPNAPSSSTNHQASFGVRPRRSALSAPSPYVTCHPRRLAEACIRPIHVDPEEAVDVADGVPDTDAFVSPTRGGTLPGALVAMPDLLGLDLSHHPSAYLCANEV